MEEAYKKGLIEIQKEGDDTLSVIEKQFDVDATGDKPKIVELEPRIQRLITKDGLLTEKARLEGRLEQINFLLAKHAELPLPSEEEMKKRQKQK